MIHRPRYADAILTALGRAPVCALLGPRQCGKTTLAREIAKDSESHYFDLESPRDGLRLRNPELALGELGGLVILDEIQLRPDLFGVLRVLADRPGSPARFLILGSAAPELVKRSADSLAGRIEVVDLHGFDLGETGPQALGKLWLRGGFPRSFLAASEADGVAWREGFVRTFLERDLPQLGITVAAPAMRRFWTMLAHSHGRLWNGSELGRSMGLSDKTVRGYLDDLTQTYVIRQLQPWFENLGKRQVKSPKVYLRDSGLLHHLLGLESAGSIHGHPAVGASWEGFAMEQILRIGRVREPYFWATQGGSELDLLVIRDGRREGFEFKYSENPGVSRSTRIVIGDLGLDRLRIICPGDARARIDDKIEIRGLAGMGGEEEIWD